MHGVHIVGEILSKAREEGRVKKAVIEVGEIANIEKDHLAEHLKDWADFPCELNEKESKVRCKCGYEGKAKIKDRGHDFVIIECPECGEIPEILEGNQVILKSVEVED